MPASQITADIIVDLQYGDCGKGKIAHALCHKNQDYTHTMRYNGGANAGHTIYHKGGKFVTHQIPIGVFYGIPSIIGPGCVVYPESFLEEIKELNDHGIKTDGMIFVADNAHIVTKAHLEEDGNDTKIGTTKKGIGQAYRDKVARQGIRAKDITGLEEYLIDVYETLHTKGPATILCDGAQGFGLDIDWGDYPFVTSSHATSAGALTNGIPPQAVRDVWGVGKIYETYVGAKAFEPDEEVFRRIRELGQEYGATTGRPRQVNWLNIDLLERAIRINGVTQLVINKVDILREAGVWMTRNDAGEITDHTSEQVMVAFIEDIAKQAGVKKVYFSDNPETF